MGAHRLQCTLKVPSIEYHCVSLQRSAAVQNTGLPQEDLVLTWQQLLLLHRGEIEFDLEHSTQHALGLTKLVCKHLAAIPSNLCYTVALTPHPTLPKQSWHTVDLEAVQSQVNRAYTFVPS